MNIKAESDRLAYSVPEAARRLACSTGLIYRLAPIESDVPERTMGKVAPLAGPTKSRWPLNWPRRLTTTCAAAANRSGVSRPPVSG